MEQNIAKYKIKKYLSLGCLLYIIILTLLTVSPSWNIADHGLCIAVLVSSVIALLCLSISHDIKFNKLDAIILIWWLYCTLHIYASPEIISGRQFVRYTSLMEIYITLRIIFNAYRPKAKIIETVLLLAATYEMVLGSWQIITGNSYQTQFSITGSFFNSGPYSAYVMIGIVIAISFLKDMNTKEIGSKKMNKTNVLIYFYVLICIVGIFILFVTCSRSAIITTGLFCLCFFLKNIRKYRITLLIIAIAVTCVLLYIKLGSAIGRLVIWFLSGKIFIKHFLLGTGLGSFPYQYGEELRDIFGGNSYHPQIAKYVDVTDFSYCDLLQIAVEQGIIGLSICAACVVLVLCRLRIQAKPLFYGVLSLLIFSLFSYPFSLMPYQLIFVLCAAWCGNVKKCENTIIINRTYLGVGCFIFLISGYKGINYCIQRIKATKEYCSMCGQLDYVYKNDYYRLYPACNDNKYFLFDFARLLQRDKRYLDSNAMLDDGLKISNDPIFLDVMGNNYKDMGFYNEALHCYQAAFNTLPNRIYPLYCEMKLYEHIKDRKHLSAAARKVIDFQPKISSQATKEMKLEAHKLLLYNVIK